MATVRRPPKTTAKPISASIQFIGTKHGIVKKTVPLKPGCCGDKKAPGKP